MGWGWGVVGSGGLLERMAACGPDIVSIDGSVDLKDAITRCGKEFAYQVLPQTSMAHRHLSSC